MIHETKGLFFDLDLEDHIQRTIYEQGEYEWAESALIPTFLRSGMTALDIGANIGYFALLFARLVGRQGRVLAFEPNPATFLRLLRNVRLNGMAIECMDVALAEARRTVAKRADDGPSGNRGGWTLLSGLGAGDDITCVPLDDVVRDRQLARVDFLKIDVEGYEQKVLEGAGATLRRFHPFIMIEYNAEYCDAACQRWIDETLRGLGYGILRIHKKPWVHLKPVRPADFSGAFQFNALCVPEARGLSQVF